MLLATYEHHAALRGQSVARSRKEESEMNNATFQKTPPPRAASTVYFTLDDDGDVLAARPTPLVEVRPQPGSQRCTSLTSCLSCRSSMCLCRRWGIRWWMCCRRSTRRRLSSRFCGAHDLSGPDPAALCVSSSAQGRTVGGSANDRILFFFTAADCRAELRHSSS